MITRLLRASAILIAVAAAIDPAITSTRSSKPEISVVPADSSQNEVLAARVARELARKFTIIRAPFAGAAGTVIVGNQLPAPTTELATPVFAVMPEREGPTVTLEAVHAAARSPVDARVPITAVARVNGGRGRKLEVTLRMGDLVVDRAIRDIVADNEQQHVPLVFVPTAAGAVPLRITAQVAGGPQSATADLVIDVREKRWAVLFFDPRPSWISTFVRRALERDPRFVVTSRVVTSRNVSTAAGRPPAALDQLTSLALFDAVVIGAPEALSERDVTGLDAFLRRRGGSVVLLFDRRARGPYERLSGVISWAGASRTQPFAIDAVEKESGALRASEIIWPAVLPSGAIPLALTADSLRRPVIWRSAIGAGRLVLSGALNAWQSRDPAVSGFERFWQTLIAEISDAAPPPIDVAVAQSMLAPGQSTQVVVTIRDAGLAEISSSRAVRASISAAMETADGRTNLRLWPDGRVGRFSGSLRAPDTPGSYRVVVASDGAQTAAPIVVAVAVSHPAPDETDLLRAWAVSRGGAAVRASQLEQLPAALSKAVQPVQRRETWHPMRSVWWIIPFTLALGAEWWWRRRRGLA